MRLSKMFGKTIREIPADADTISHQYLLRAGMISQLTSGVYSMLPLGRKVLAKIEGIIRDEMNKADGQEVVMPVIQPVEIWRRSGREAGFGETLFHLKDRRDHELVLGPTHEEVITDLAARCIQSYRDLPQRLYQIQVKLRDEQRPRGGLLRVREFIMKDLYSFDSDDKGLDESYTAMRQAYINIFSRCGLPALLIEADSGAIGGKDSQEFMLVAESGEDEIIYCENCKKAANVEKMASIKSSIEPEDPLPIEEVSTPGLTSIEEISGFLKVAPDHTIKAVLYLADGEFVMAVIRGDLEINEIKLKHLLKCTDLEMADENRVRAAGIVGGFVSPVGLNGKVKIVGDTSIVENVNFAAGGNKKDVHLKNVNYNRDFTLDVQSDIANAKAGDKCPECGGILSSIRGIEVGHIFKLGTALSEKLGARFLDADGSSKPVIMGCYGIGVGRLMAAAVEQSHDDKGIIWPLPIAPYQVHICGLFMDKPGVSEAAEKLYSDLQSQGIEVLFDDRPESPGVKFNDADLIGIPYRITISARTLKSGSVEFKERSAEKAEIIPVEDIVDYIKKLLEQALAN
jgi:prolyl-tRNA synthetase